MVALQGTPAGRRQSSLAYQVLESLIASIDLPPGAIISAEQIEKVLGIGRTPVREALKLLQADGLIVLRQKTGVRIALIEPDRQLKILEVRRPLDVLASALATQHGNARDREGLAALADELLAVGARNDDRSLMRLGTACYHQMLAMTDNPYLYRPLLSAYSLSRRYYFTRITGGEMMLHTAKLHHARFRAIVDGRSLEAEQATHALLDYFVSVVIASQTDGV
jgi:DNA-binding GntR family transcriptional regulator